MNKIGECKSEFFSAQSYETSTLPLDPRMTEVCTKCSKISNATSSPVSSVQQNNSKLFSKLLISSLNFGIIHETQS